MIYQTSIMPPVNLDTFYKDLGNLIRKARVDADISQDILAQQLGLTRASIVNIEKGRQRPMIHTILELATILKVNFASLIPGASVIDTPPASSPSFAEDEFEKIVSDDLNLDFSTKDAVKKFVSHLK